MLIVQLVPRLEEVNKPTVTAREYSNSVFNFSVVMICHFYHTTARRNIPAWETELASSHVLN